MVRRLDAILFLLFVVLMPALLMGQEVQDSWLDGEALMLDMISAAAPEQAVLKQFRRDCRIAMDTVMARHLANVSDGPLLPVLSCREPRHWEAVTAVRERIQSRQRHHRPFHASKRHRRALDGALRLALPERLPRRRGWI